MKKALLSLGAAAVLGLASASASAEFADFRIDESVVPGVGAQNASPSLWADKLNGFYNEILTISGTDFSSSGYGRFTALVRNEGQDGVDDSFLNAPNNVGGYNMYFVFSAEGTFTPPNGFTGSSGSFRLFLDPDKNTTLGLPADGNTAVVPGGVTGDDIEIAFAINNIFGEGTIGAPGAFQLIFDDFTLTDFGKTYFVEPEPFHLVVDITGDFDTFPNAFPDGNFQIGGDVSAVFRQNEVPEPGSLALVGMSLGVLGLVAQRRRQTKKN